MKRSAGALALVAAASLGLPLSAAPASAAAPTTLYVNNVPAANCSDAGSGTPTQPYCTLAAAADVVTAGQTVMVVGTYQEHLTLTHSGAPGQPITFQGQTGPFQMTGPTGGVTIDGQHDVVIGQVSITGARTATGIAVSNSTRITIDHSIVFADGTSLVEPGVHLAAVTDSTVTRTIARGPFRVGVLLDAATSGVTVKSSSALLYGLGDNKGIDVFGSNNTIVGDNAENGSAADIAIEPGARNNVVADNFVQNGKGRGIDVAGASGTAITNNTVKWLCGTGIRVGDGSSGTSLQNNVSTVNGTPQSYCPTGIPDPVDIGVYGTAAGDTTTVDYNTVSGRGDHAYAWNTPMTLAAFRTASGQGAHDIDNDLSSVNVDSANSAAPGWQSVDHDGHPAADDPGSINTGAGPIRYADRGSSERIGPPIGRLTVTARGAMITADASGSAAWMPFTLSKYIFNFGDGTTVTQSSPIAWHVYPRHTYGQDPRYPVTVMVTDSNGNTGTSQIASWVVLPGPLEPRRPAPARTLR